jgi:hypothetical protein
MQNINNITNIITSKFKENVWCDKELVDKRKLRYYKEVINHNLDQNYLSVLKSAKKKINNVKIRSNSHELYSETGCWTTILKSPWDERIYHICDTKRVEDEKHFILDSLSIPILDPNLKISSTSLTLLTS